MAKRWLIQKRLKEKRYREKGRGVMKRYSAERVNAGSSPNKEVMSWYVNSARGLGVSMQDLYRYNRQPVSEERQAVLDKRRQIKEARPEWLYFRLVDDGFLRARLYYSNNPDRCCIIELDKRSSRLRRSIIYRSRDVAYQRWCSHTIDWVEPTLFYHPHIPETFPEQGL